MGGPIIDIVRHAQAYNNIPGPKTLDPDLTHLGNKQCDKLRDSYPHMDRVKLIVSSPLRRTIQTACTAFSTAIAQDLPRIALLAELQENSARAGDTGSPLSALSTLVEELGFPLDTSELRGGGETWYHKGPGTAYYPSLKKVEERARVARVWIRNKARELDDGDRLVVVTHGAFAHFLVQDFAGLHAGRGSGVWLNAGFRSFQFVDLLGDDPDAAMSELPATTMVQLLDSRGMPTSPWCELTSEEQALNKSYAVARLKRHELDAFRIFSREFEWDDLAGMFVPRTSGISTDRTGDDVD
ncbi:histidine phosphatase superfamily [Nemania serpens]|nr:histidine phosphatase superfamily [Nemania serpens]